MTFANMT